MTLIKFTAKGCAPCQAMKKAKTVEQLAQKYDLDLEVYDTDDDKVGRPLSDRLNVEFIPTVLLIGPREKELARHEGAGSLKMLEQTFAKHLAKL